MAFVKLLYMFGSSLAICMSWGMEKNISLTVLHGVLSWFYVIYYAIKESRLLD